MKKKIKMLLMVLVSLSVFFVTGSVSFAYDGDFNVCKEKSAEMPFLFSLPEV